MTIIKLKRRSIFGVILRLPWIFFKHYKILRESNKKKESFRMAFCLTKLLFKKKEIKNEQKRRKSSARE